MTKSTPDNVRAVLLHLLGEGYGAVDYPFLLGYLRGVGIEPSGMDPILRQLQREGDVSRKDSNGVAWSSFDENAGPLWIHLRPALLLTPAVLERAFESLRGRQMKETSEDIGDALEALLQAVTDESEAANG